MTEFRVIGLHKTAFGNESCASRLIVSPSGRSAHARGKMGGARFLLGTAEAPSVSLGKRDFEGACRIWLGSAAVYFVSVAATLGSALSSSLCHVPGVAWMRIEWSHEGQSMGHSMAMICTKPTIARPKEREFSS